MSRGLQSYFDATKKSGKSKRDTAKKLKNIESQIDARFLASFGEFKTRILGIVEETPEAESLVLEELEGLNIKLTNSHRRHNLKKAATIIEAVS